MVLPRQQQHQQQTYGRRRRARQAIYAAPLVATDDSSSSSPPRTNLGHRSNETYRGNCNAGPAKPEDVDVLEVADELHRLKVTDGEGWRAPQSERGERGRGHGRGHGRGGSRRTVLGPADGNAGAVVIAASSSSSSTSSSSSEHGEVAALPERPVAPRERERTTKYDVRTSARLRQDRECELDVSSSRFRLDRGSAGVGGRESAISCRVAASSSSSSPASGGLTRSERPARQIPQSVLIEETKPPLQPTPPSLPSLATAPVKSQDIYTKHCETILSLCSEPIMPFETWAAELSSHLSICKTAEASFGEVYRLSLLESETVPEFSRNDESVIKVIALRPPRPKLRTKGGKNAARGTKTAPSREKLAAMSEPADVATEIRLLHRMTAIPGFTNFRDARVVQGRPPASFIDAFKAYNAAQEARGKEKSLFPDPQSPESYDEDQLWAVIEMQDAGVDLERWIEDGACGSVFDVWDIFWQTALALAKGEQAAQFEHRDMHLGNICVRCTTTGQSSGGDARALTARRSTTRASTTRRTIDTKRTLGFTGIETTLIDYTLSRALTPDQQEPVAYLDLERDKSLFTADSTDEYQFEIYRYMRGAVLLHDPMADFEDATVKRAVKAATTQDRWRHFRPITNLLWLHFVLFKLTEQMVWPRDGAKPAKTRRRKLAEWQRAVELERVLRRVHTLLDPATVQQQGEVASACDLITVAVREDWLSFDDVVGMVDDREYHHVADDIPSWYHIC